jgi:Transposase.
MDWEWEKSAKKIYSKEHQDRKVPWLFGFNWKWSPFSGMCHYWWRVLGVWVTHFNLSKAQKVKCMLICFFDIHGIVHKEFLPQGQTTNQHFYREVLEKLRKRVICERPNIKNKWVLHHDDAPCHTAISINECLTSKNIPVAPQPPYSPDLSPCDFFIFPNLKNHLKGTYFGTDKNIETGVTDQLKAIPVPEWSPFSAMRSERNVPSVVWLQKEVILKVTI